MEVESGGGGGKGEEGDEDGDWGGDEWRRRVMIFHGKQLL